MSALPSYIPRMSVEAYLELERITGLRFEYDRGYAYAMAGASEDHMIITSNLDTLLNTQLDDKPCQPFTESMRVALPGKNYYYPDVVVTCGERSFEIRQDGKTLLNPIVLVEVMSDSTQDLDRIGKLAVYQRILSLCDYLIVAQDRVFVTHHTRREGVWTSQDYSALTDEIALPSIGCTLTLARVYKKVTWA